MAVYDSVLIVGGKGMLAHAVIEQLGRRGVTYAAVDSDSCDITRPEQVRNVFSEVRPTLVLNCAAFTNVDKCETSYPVAEAVNGTGVGTLAELCGERGAKLVHISTDFVFDGQGTRPYRVDDEPAPISAYGRSKLLGEELIRKHNPPGWIIARTAWLYGTNGHCFPKAILDRARTGAPLKVVSDQVGSPTHTVDVAEGIFNLVDAGGQGIFHLTNSGQTSWFGFTQAILEQFELKTELSPQSAADWKKLKPDAANRPSYSVLDNSRYSAVTGKPLRPWREALADYHGRVMALSAAPAA